MTRAPRQRRFWSPLLLGWLLGMVTAVTLIGVGWLGFAILTSWNSSAASEQKAEQDALAGQAREPKSFVWPEKLGNVYSRLARWPRNDRRKPAELRRLAWRSYERAYTLGEGPGDRCGILAELATSAFEAGEYDRAAYWVDVMLRDAAPPAHPWEGCAFDQRVHHGHTTKGLLALRSKNLGAAKTELLASAEIPGDPVLSSFGPNMSLAKALLQAGERESVIAYFERCRKFWKNDWGKLSRWTAEVRRGEIPEFSANLVY